METKLDVCKNAGNRQKDKKENGTHPRVEPEHALEAKHRRLRELAEVVRTKYYEAYRQMVSELSPSHIDEFAAVLRDCQKHVVQNQDELTIEIREQLMRSLQSSLDRFWEEYSISNRIAELEMLKEQYKQFEGKEWNIQQMNPFQRTLPVRMRFKELRLHHLEKQLAHQDLQLETLLQINLRERARINYMEQLRKSMLMRLERYSKYMEQTKSEVKSMTSDLIDDFEKDLILK
ncbi:uncharacterized protein LOC128866860 [Anastrepha ludens]|uniref:uncharacterized protein LOC128866860 n=1 Tax=Anastrepha ludens TaxID=28586 RepID=UPI0023B0DDB9|nr:uncharacterized protein LOC128866860 [Anastrepha ludens]